MVREKIRSINKVTNITYFSGKLKMKKEKLYKGRLFEVNAYNMQVEHRRVRREVIEHPGAAAMLAFDEKGKVLLVKQHRFPHGYILEIPAGTLEKGEKPIDCAYREIIEETGYKAKKMTKLVSYFPSVGYNKEEIHVFVASDTKKEFDLKLDNDEFITVVKMDIKKLIGMIKAGKIIDSKTICAVMIYAAKKKLF
jgi:ADP-ribose pyrophosphatase